LIVRGVRRALSTERVPETWLERVEAEGHGIVEDEPLDREAQGDEMLLMGLRLKEGVDLTRYRMMTGRPIDPARLTLLAADGFVEPAPGGRLRATPEAWPVLDAIVADLAA
jgi:oxygen-independent coproporphyrinogen-3 oxidase